MKMLNKFENFIIPGKPISQEAIAIARHTYQYNFGSNPTEIRMSRGALAELCRQVDVKMPVTITNESVQGMLIKIDPLLSNGEWLVGSMSEKISTARAIT